MVVSQFAKMAISRHWHFWQVKFWPGWCSNSPKWRFRDTGTFGRSNFGHGGVPIRQNGDFETLELLAGQILARVVFQFAKMAISRHWHFGSSNFGQGGVPIRQNGDFETLALSAGKILAISRDWHSGQAYFVLVVCQFANRTNSRNWSS